MGFEDFGEVITDPYRELHPKFRWKLVPVVGANGWQSYEEYQREAVHLKPWQDKLVDILGDLK